MTTLTRRSLLLVAGVGLAGVAGPAWAKPKRPHPSPTSPPAGGFGVNFGGSFGG